MEGRRGTRTQARGRRLARGLAMLLLAGGATASASNIFVEDFSDDPIISGRFFLEDPQTGDPQFVYQPGTQSLLVHFRSGAPTVRLVHPLGRTLTHRDSFIFRATFRMAAPAFPDEYFAQVSFGLVHAASGSNRNDDVAANGAFDTFSFDYLFSPDYPTLSANIISSRPNPDFPGSYYGAWSFPAYNESLLNDPGESRLPYTTLTGIVEYDGAARHAVLRVLEGAVPLAVNVVGEGLEEGGLDGDPATIVTPLKSDPEDPSKYGFRVDRIGLFSWLDDWSTLMGYASGVDVVFERIELEWTLYPDLDGNGTVDVDDVESMRACRTGPSVAVQDPACEAADLDGDLDVDQDDFGLLQVHFGTQRP